MAKAVYYVDEHDRFSGHFVWSSYPVEADFTEIEEAFSAALELQADLIATASPSAIYTLRAAHEVEEDANG